jgi:hypothetical protein
MPNDDAIPIPKNAQLGEAPIPKGATLGGGRPEPVIDAWYSKGPYSIYNIATGRAPVPTFKSVLGGVKDFAVDTFKGLSDPTNVAMMMSGGGLKGPRLPGPGPLGVPKVGGEGLPAGTDIKPAAAPTAPTETGATASRPEPGVSTVPEPRPEVASDKPGSQWSVPREELLGRAQRGEPGAADVMRQVQPNPVLYQPRGVIAGEKVQLPWETPPPQATTGLQGKPLPFTGPPKPSSSAGSVLSEPGTEGGESQLDAIIRGAPGVDPVLKSLQRNIKKRPTPFQ